MSAEDKTMVEECIHTNNRGRLSGSGGRMSSSHCELNNTVRKTRVFRFGCEYTMIHDVKDVKNLFQAWIPESKMQ